MRRVHTYEPGKVGEDIALGVRFVDGDGDGVEVSAAIVSIWDADENLVVTDQPVTMLSAYEGEYLWTPTAPGRYTGEWHDLLGERDGFSSDFVIDIQRRIGVQGEFVAEDADEAPLALQRIDLGVHTVPEGSAAGELVAITAEGVADTYATRAAGDPVAADAVIRAKISDTTAWLAQVATVEGLSGLTAGALLYLGVDGAITHDQTTTDGELDQCVGEALSETRAVLWTLDRGTVVGLYAEADGVTAALALKAPLASPALTGNPTAPTQLQADDSTRLATTAYVRAAISALLAGVSSAFDTLAEIATELAAKLSLSGGRMTGALGTTIGTFAPSAGAASLDATARNVFASTAAITQATLLTITGGQDGDIITVHLAQDATGYAVTFAAAGRTVVYMEGAVPTTASKAVDCTCAFVTVNGVAQVRVHSTVGA